MLGQPRVLIIPLTPRLHGGLAKRVSSPAGLLTRLRRSVIHLISHYPAALLGDLTHLLLGLLLRRIDHITRLTRVCLHYVLLSIGFPAHADAVSYSPYAPDSQEPPQLRQRM